MRLDKFLKDTGFGSRKEVKVLIKQKRDKFKELSNSLNEHCNTFIEDSSMNNFYRIFNFFFEK